MHPGQEVDMDLAQRAAQGDIEALTFLLQTSRRRLLTFLEPKIPQELRGHLDAEDILQDAFIAVFRHVSHFQPRDSGSFFRWIATIALRKLRDALAAARTVKRGGGRCAINPGDRRIQDSATIFLDTVISPGTRASSMAVRRQEVEAVLSAVNALPTDQQVAVNLIHFNGVSAALAAKLMGTTEAAVQGHCRRGVEGLRRQMGVETARRRTP